MLQLRIASRGGEYAMKILIVDDQPDVVKGILSGVNWERVGVDAAFGAHSGEEAKQVLQEEHIDILLCDIEMPGENGLEFFSWVRERYQDVKCIFLTAHADFTYAQKALKLEAADYLLQPASYAGVESSILRVSERIREEQLVRSYSSVGKDALREAIGFRRNILREFLQGVQMSAQEAAEKAGVFGFPCTPDTRCRCFWLQIQRWEGKPWEYGLLIYGMQNILSELLEECSSHVTLFHGGKDAYDCGRFGPPEGRRSYGAILRDMQELVPDGGILLCGTFDGTLPRTAGGIPASPGGRPKQCDQEHGLSSLGGHGAANGLFS